MESTSPPGAPEPLVRVHTQRGVATITLDSPHNRNALSRALVDQLGQALAEAAGDERVRAIVLTHSGGTFCAGADLSEARGGSMTQGADDLFGLLEAIATAPKPVLARVTGHVRAGGMGLVAACDVVVAGERATFALTEVRIGLAPAVISAALLPRLTPRSAGRYFLTGETFGAAEAERIGLVTQAPPEPPAVSQAGDDAGGEAGGEAGAGADAGVDAVVEAYLDAFRRCSPQGLRESKALATAPLRASLAAGRVPLTDLSARLFGSEEAREGMTAFLERRPPRWAEPAP